MSLYIFLILSLTFMSLLTGVLMAAKFEKSNRKHWAWATALCVMLFIALIVKDHLSTVENANITGYKNTVLQEKLTKAMKK